MASILVGIVNWNQKEDVLECLRLLHAVSEPLLDIVVVDNASTDGSPEAIQQAHPEVRVIINPANRGAAGGRNDLFTYFLRTQADYLMILDPDVSVTPDCFQHLTEEINRSAQIGCVGVKAYYADRPNVFWCRGGAVYNPWFGRFEKLGQKEMDRGQYNKREDIHSIPAGFTFIRRSVIEKVPRMDERYFIYFEESDWNFKIRKAGYRLVTSGKAKVYHKVSSSLGMESPFFYYYRTRNNLLFVVKNSPWYCLPVFFFYYFLYRIPDTLLTLWLSKQYRQMQGVLLGLLDFFRWQWYACPYPDLAQKNQAATPETVSNISQSSI